MNSQIKPYPATGEKKHTDPEELDLHTLWVWGGCSKPNWKLRELATIQTVADLWYVINRCINIDTFDMNIRRPDRWFFRDGFLPDWDLIKKNGDILELIEMTIAGINKADLIKILLWSSGETLPGGEDLLGVRIKPSPRYGGDIRLWITNQTSAITIKKFVLQEIKNKKMTVKMVNL